MDEFSAQIVRFVRAMPDEALLDLVKQKLGVLSAAVSRSAERRAGSPVRAVTAATQEAKRVRDTANAGPTALSADRQHVLDNVERIVKAGSGMSASDVAKAAAIPQTRAASALKELKLGKRIFQGGDRRFARYAGDARTAEQASATARKNAKGPIVRAPQSAARPKKRGAAIAASAAG